MTDNLKPPEQVTLTKREYFAAMALIGVVGGAFAQDKEADPPEDWAATRSVEYADALISALNEDQSND